MASRWYVVHVYSGFEKKVAQDIEKKVQQSGMEDRIQEVLESSKAIILVVDSKDK